MGIAVGPATTGELDEAARWLRGNAGDGWAIQIGCEGETEPTLAWCRDNGLVPAGAGWAKLGLGAALAPPSPTPSVDVLSAGATDAMAFGRTVQEGFGLPAPVAAWFAALVGRPGWSTYLVVAEAAPVAAAAMFVSRGAAWLGVDRTLPAFRARGAQSALIGRRVRDALAGGATHVTAETAYPTEDAGDGDASFRNYVRAGFALAYRRRNHAPPRDRVLA